jgi:hypothetical protein
MYGTEINGIRRSHAWTGEGNAGLAGEMKKAAVQRPERIVVTADATGETYRLTVEARGESTSITDVDAANLAAQVSRLIAVVSKAAQAGDLDKHRQSDSSPFGLGAPRSNRENLRHR